MFCFQKGFSIGKTFFRPLCGALQAGISRPREVGGGAPGLLAEGGCCRDNFLLARAAAMSGSTRQPLSLEMLPRPM